MALTEQQISDCRRWMGYSLSGDETTRPMREPVYTDATWFGSMDLYYRLQHLNTAEENTLTTFYLPNLAQREQDIQAAAANLDTDVAAVWVHNKSEVSDRRELFRQLRLDLCDFLGFPPGRALTRGNRLVRA